MAARTAVQKIAALLGIAPKRKKATATKRKKATTAKRKTTTAKRKTTTAKGKKKAKRKTVKRGI